MTRIMMLPGWMHGADFWRPLMPHIPGGCSALALDWQDVLSADALAQRVRDVSHPVVMVGWSLGAMAALRVALEAPELLKSMVLMGATSRLPGDGEYSGVSIRRLRAMRIALRKNAAECYRSFFELCGVDDSALSQVTEDALDTPLNVADAGLDALLSWDLRDRVSQVKIPVHLVHAEGDAVVPVSQAKWLHGRLPGSGELRVVPGEGHTPGEESWAALAALLRKVVEAER